MKLFLLILCVSIDCIGSSAVIGKLAPSEKAQLSHRSLRVSFSGNDDCERFALEQMNIHSLAHIASRIEDCKPLANEVFRSEFAHKPVLIDFSNFNRFIEKTGEKQINFAQVFFAAFGRSIKRLEEFEANCETDLFRNDNDFAGKNVRCVVLSIIRV